MRCKYLLLFLTLLVGSGVSAAPIKTLLITGQNNHNWSVSHQVLKQVLENSALFEVTLAISPKAGEDMSGFIIDFDQYALVVLDYNGDNWPQLTRDRFVQYVQNGGGVVVYHAANNAFSQWPEYNRITALGGWENRNEKAGPWVYWQDGGLVRDSTSGPGGAHGPMHDFAMTARNTQHPITKGLPAVWMHKHDELYDRMRGPGNIKDLLYTAYSSKEKNGSGREEPLIFTVDYGKGRIFHTMLGHAGSSVENSPAMQCAGFQITLLRGAEWAATGKVKQKVPKDFPGDKNCVLRTDYK